MSPCSVYTSNKNRGKTCTVVGCSCAERERNNSPQRFHGCWREFLQCWVAPWPWMTSRLADRYASGSWGGLSFSCFWVEIKWWINCSHSACIINWSKPFFSLFVFGEWHKRHHITIIYHCLRYLNCTLLQSNINQTTASNIRPTTVHQLVLYIFTLKVFLFWECRQGSVHRSIWRPASTQNTGSRLLPLRRHWQRKWCHLFLTYIALKVGSVTMGWVMKWTFLATWLVTNSPSATTWCEKPGSSSPIWTIYVSLQCCLLCLEMKSFFLHLHVHILWIHTISKIFWLFRTPNPNATSSCEGHYYDRRKMQSLHLDAIHNSPCTESRICFPDCLNATNIQAISCQKHPVSIPKKTDMEPEANSMAAHCHGGVLQQLTAVLKPELFGYLRLEPLLPVFPGWSVAWCLSFPVFPELSRMT